MGANYIGIFHLDERPDTDDGCGSNNACDSNGSFDAAFSSGMTNADRVSAKIGNGTDFDGTDDYIPMGFNNEVDNLFATSGNAWSVSAWFRHPNEITADNVVIGRAGGTGGSATYDLYVESSDDDIRTIIRGTQTDGAVNGDDGNWHFATTTWDGSSGALAIDGGSAAISIGTANQQSYSILIGAVVAGSTAEWVGQIDEVRFSDTARSSAWVKADYHSTNDGMVDWGSEEVIPELVVLLLPIAGLSPLIVKYFEKKRRLIDLKNVK